MPPMKKEYITSATTGMLIVLMVSFVMGQAASGRESTATPPPSVTAFFPSSPGYPILACPTGEISQLGPTWRGITIGVSTLDELDQILDPSQALLPIRVMGQWGNTVSLNYRGMPVCAQGDIVTVIEIGPVLLSLSDFIAAYGIPDAVTWAPDVWYRVAFWFEEGVAAEVWSGTARRASEPHWGYVIKTLYFPYQSAVGYETRWPYAATYPEAPGPWDVADQIPMEQNPFDLDAMIATMTAQPSRTLIPTFTPGPLQTATPTPMPEQTSTPES